ncbi:hypothetical protein K490DRAFT_66860 [Saccharata proteae CBS 121410]|uniref:Uncharacterized protein n=1 Tax=Saccharata proteae CBS 121410 TaxID=1314787 RepID=A0A9P4LYT9_9PEZI|nr:hypothetical protein K490DRAFT_66860 [Saccharata proteae CBS 121410]
MQFYALRQTPIHIRIGPDRKIYNSFAELVSHHSKTLKTQLSVEGRIFMNGDDDNDIPTITLENETTEGWEAFDYFANGNVGDALFSTEELESVGYDQLVEFYLFGVRLNAPGFQNEVLDAFYRLREVGLAQVEDEIKRVSRACESKAQRRALLEFPPRPQPRKPLSIEVLNSILPRIYPNSLLHTFLVHHVSFALVQRLDSASSYALDALPATFLWQVLKACMDKQKIKYGGGAVVVNLEEDDGDRGPLLPAGMPKALMVQWIMISSAALKHKLKILHKCKGVDTADFFDASNMCAYHRHPTAALRQQCETNFEDKNEGRGVWEDEARILSAIDEGLGLKDKK